jgi:hypothetical protein
MSALAKIFHLSKASTVQALLLLGHRDFGMGSMEAAWANIGLAIRMVRRLSLVAGLAPHKAYLLCTTRPLI